MIEIPFVLVPIITLALIALIAFLFNGFNLSEPQSDMGFFLLMILGIVFSINIAYYIIKGLVWAYHHITFV